jgi:hypothetical protein
MPFTRGHIKKSANQAVWVNHSDASLETHKNGTNGAGIIVADTDVSIR